MNLTSYLQDRQLTICLTGEIDHHTAREMMDILGHKVTSYLPSVCILDYNDVTFMDSSGIAIVLFMLRRMREIEGTLVLKNIAPQPYKVMQASGLDKLIELSRR